MTIKQYLHVFSIIVATLAISQQTRAQFNDSMGTNWNNAMSASASTMIWNSIFYRVPRKTGGSASKQTAVSQPRSQVVSKPLNRSNDDTSMRFKPVSKNVKTREFADQLGNTQTERDQYFTLMNAVLEGFGRRAAAAGKQNDLALALSYFLAENSRIYHRQPDLSDAQFLELRDIIASALRESGALISFTDRQKQEMYEALVAYTGITQYGYEQALKAGNQEIARGFQKVAGQNLLTVTKLSPDRIDFGPGGLSISPQ